MGDEQESMIDKYLEKGDMFLLLNKEPICVCVVLQLDSNTYEIKNLAVEKSFQRKGYGTRMLEYIFNFYKPDNVIYAGTGENPATIGFYEKCGFVYSHKIANFFTENYDHKIIENGVELVDMVYLKKVL